MVINDILERKMKNDFEFIGILLKIECMYPGEQFKVAYNTISSEAARAYKVAEQDYIKCVNEETNEQGVMIKTYEKITPCYTYTELTGEGDADVCLQKSYC